MPLATGTGLGIPDHPLQLQMRDRPMPTGLANLAMERFPEFADPAIYSVYLRSEWIMTVHT